MYRAIHWTVGLIALALWGCGSSDGPGEPNAPPLDVERGSGPQGIQGSGRNVSAQGIEGTGRNASARGIEGSGRPLLAHGIQGTGRAVALAPLAGDGGSGPEAE
jgi:hypothetical protein